MKKLITLGIDASNLRAGGGRTHLIELLKAADPCRFGIVKIYVWGSSTTLSLIENRSWLEKISVPQLERSLIFRLLWQRFKFSDTARESGCDILFIPGGIYFGDFYPVVGMSQNMLPFEFKELVRYGFTFSTIRLILLRYVQKRTFRKVSGVIFLTNYAKNEIERISGSIKNKTVIPHGLNERFLCKPRVQFSIENYSKGNPLRIIYVSIVDIYKHQWHVVQGLAKMRLKTGWSIVLDLYGPSYLPAKRLLDSSIARFDSNNDWVRYHGSVPYEEIHSICQSADIGIFASSCENMPNILLELMASGLPIACSNKGPMKEIIGDSGCFFDPELPDEIANAVEGLILDTGLRSTMAQANYERAQKFNWRHCSNETFAFLFSTLNI